MRRLIEVLLLVAFLLPAGCGGGMTEAERYKIRLEFFASRRASYGGARLEVVLDEIRFLDPEWYVELIEAGRLSKRKE